MHICMQVYVYMCTQLYKFIGIECMYVIGYVYMLAGREGGRAQRMF